MSQITQLSHQIVDLLLKKGLAPSDADGFRFIRGNAFYERRDRLKLTLIIRIFGVAVIATQGTAGGPHKNCRQPHARGFALNTAKDLIDLDHVEAIWNLTSPMSSRGTRLWLVYSPY